MMILKMYTLEEETHPIDISLKSLETHITLQDLVIMKYFNRTNFNEEESIRRFSQQLRSLGVVKTYLENKAFKVVTLLMSRI